MEWLHAADVVGVGSRDLKDSSAEVHQSLGMVLAASARPQIRSPAAWPPMLAMTQAGFVRALIPRWERPEMSPSDFPAGSMRRAMVMPAAMNGNTDTCALMRPTRSTRISAATQPITRKMSSAEFHSVDAMSSPMEGLATPMMKKSNRRE